MSKFMLEHDRPNCIGCGSCAAINPKHWKMNGDGKSDIEEGKQRPDGWQELEITDKDLEADKQAAESCPVNVMRRKEKKKKKKII